MSARTTCPKCRKTHVDEAKVLFSERADFFQCHDCGGLWHVEKGQDGPPSQELLGKVGADAVRSNWVRR